LQALPGCGRQGFKWAFLPLFLLFVLSGNHALAATTVNTANLGANQVTLQITSTSGGQAAFTLLQGASANCGTAVQTAAGQDSTGAAAYRFGSLYLASGSGNYTVRNLAQSTAYTACVSVAGGAAVSANLTTNAGATFSTGDWKTVGAAGFSAAGSSYESLAFAPDGTPYVAYSDSNMSSMTTVEKFDGTNWVNVGMAGFSAGAADFQSLAFAPDGTPYVAYRDSSNIFKPAVMKFDGTNWVAIGAGTLGAGTWPNGAGEDDYESLAFAPDGTPYIAYSDHANSNNTTVMKFDGTNWVTVGAPGFGTGSSSGFQSLAFAPDGAPWVARDDCSNGTGCEPEVSRFNGSSWAAVGAPNPGGAGVFTALVFAPNGTPFLAYEMSAGGVFYGFAKKYDGTNWVSVGTAFSSNVWSDSSLAFAPDSTLYIAFRDAGVGTKETVEKFDGTSWVTVGTPTISVNQTYNNNFLAIAPDGSPYLAMADSANGYKATVMKLGAALSATTNAAANIGATGATLNGTVDDGGATTSVSFEYGTTTAYGTAAAATPASIPAGSGPTAISAALTGLLPNTPYHFRVDATNASGTVYGSDLSFTTTKPTPVVTWPTASGITYGQTLASSTLTNGSATYNSSAVTGTFMWAAPSTALAAGSSAQSVTFTPDSPNYLPVSNTVNVKVNQATPLTTVTPYSLTYDGNAHTATASATGLGGAALSATGFTLSGTTHTSGGSYTSDAWTFTDASGNYATVTGTVSDVIAKTSTGVSVNLGNLSQTYTGSPLAPTVTTTPSGLAVTYTYNGSTTVPTTAGTYTVVATINDPNYQGSTTGSLVIGKATTGVSVTLGNLAQSYTGSPLTPTATTTPSGLAVTYTYNGSATPPTAAGTYAVVATINDPNYQGSTTGSLVIAKATSGVSVTLGSLAQSYTGSPLTPTVTTTPSGLAVTYTYNGSATPPTAAGTYTVVATINDPNYQGSTTGSLVIAKATTGVSVTLGSLAQTYTGSPLTPTVTTTPSGLAVTYTYNGSATPPTAAGSYTVVATVNDPNYQGSATGTLTIAKATTGVSVTLGNLAQTYTGFPLTPTVTTTPSGLAVTYTYNGSATPPTAAGTYTVAATVNDPNYQGSATGTLVIGKATAAATAIRLGGLLQTYTGSPLSATASTTPSGLAVTFTYNGSATPPTAAGSYTVVATINDSNYQGTVTGAMAIGKATAGIVVTSNSNPVLVQNSITLTATVSSTASTATGTVTFLDGTTPLGTGTVNSSGVATLAISTLAVGSHSVTAVYSGDTNFTTASSSALPQIVQDFNLTISIASSGGTAGVSSVTALPGGTAVYTFTLSPVGSTTFPSTVTLSANGLPTGATYTFSPATLAAGTGSTQVTLRVNLAQLSAMNLPPTVQHTAAPAELARNKPASKLPFLALALLLLPFTSRMRRASRKLGRLLPLLLLLIGGLAAISGLSGCGSSPGYFGQAPATYTITVTGTAGVLTHSTSVTLTVQ
jgi:hypothetical protein